MAKITYATLGEVPEDLREGAKEIDGGTYEVNVSLTDKVKEFREKNIAVSKENDLKDAAITRFVEATGVSLEEIDDALPEFTKELAALRDTKKKVDDGNLVENTSLEEAVEERIKDITGGYKRQIEQIAADRDAHKKRADNNETTISHQHIEMAVRDAGLTKDIGLRPEAIKHILQDAYSAFRYEDGKLTAKSSDGTIQYGSDGVSEKTMKEYLEEQRELNPFLFIGATGGDAAGADGSGGGSNAAMSKKLEGLSPMQKLVELRKAGMVPTG